MQYDIIFPQKDVNSNIGCPSCISYIVIQGLSSWSLSSLITDPYSPNCNDYVKYKLLGSSPWDQTVFPSQKICGTGGLNYTISASPVAECHKPLFSSLTPKRASYSIQTVATGTTYSYANTTIIIDQSTQELNTCVVDKSSVFGLIAQVIKKMRKKWEYSYLFIVFEFAWWCVWGSSFASWTCV